VYTQAYDRDPKLSNLLVDAKFSQEIAARDAAWRRVVSGGGSSMCCTG
jgi:6-phosphogluconate dehydrogenase